jgi:hypothetical protein
MKAPQDIVACLVVLILATAWLPSCSAVDAAEARNAISEAESNLNSAFAAVAKAEVAGADIEGLVIQLREAGDFLSNANVKFRDGNYEAASSLAAECSKAVEGVAPEAVRLTQEAEGAKNDISILTILGTSVGLALLLVLAIAGWSRLRKRYHERVFEMRPEVQE